MQVYSTENRRRERETYFYLTELRKKFITAVLNIYDVKTYPTPLLNEIYIQNNS